jgi:hypothetical protein
MDRQRVVQKPCSFSTLVRKQWAQLLLNRRLEISRKKMGLILLPSKVDTKTQQISTVHQETIPQKGRPHLSLKPFTSNPQSLKPLQCRKTIKLQALSIQRPTVNSTISPQSQRSTVQLSPQRSSLS